MAVVQTDPSNKRQSSSKSGKKRRAHLTESKSPSPVLTRNSTHTQKKPNKNCQSCKAPITGIFLVFKKKKNQRE